MNNTIALTTTPQPVPSEDAKAAEALMPGYLVTLNSAGDAVKHPTAGAAAARTFALERDEMGKTIDTPYAVNDTVKVGTFARGQRLLAWLPAGATVAVGDPLESAGNGLLRPVTTGVALVRALQAVTNPATAVRVRVEVL